MTGGTGFLGRRLVARLAAEGWRTTVWSRAGAGRDLPPGVAVAPWPPSDIAATRDAIVALDRPTVFHLAAAGIADRAGRSAHALWDGTIARTATLAMAAAEAGAAGFVQAGSYAEYGIRPSDHPVREDAPLAATDLYGASKAAAGGWAAAVARAAGMGFAWARIFAAYGPGEAPSRLLPHVWARLAAGVPVELSPGLQVRDWIHVDDVASGLMVAAEEASAGRHGTFNLCTGAGVSVRDCVLRFARLMGADERLLAFGAHPPRPDEPAWLVGDPAALKSLGWQPRWDLAEGLRSTLDNLRATNDHA